MKTTLFGRPKRVHFVVSDGWGDKSFQVEVYRGDVERGQQQRTLFRGLREQLLGKLLVIHSSIKAHGLGCDGSTGL
ncbi:hypothetical protein [Mycolicibacterium sp. CBMA 295]|uniref:hypothetical protein n=1 Tax=Mycolicibacterium sp. CBMA 295 TaxID=2606605 RepID=UPI0012DEDA6C|nr:hypothetical protein [Mycolicibacterium sp. CBMA 295]MUM27678.1 hypothetical protein [Mycolicibacterium sp. CBMA 295]